MSKPINTLGGLTGTMRSSIRWLLAQGLSTDEIVTRINEGHAGHARSVTIRAVTPYVQAVSELIVERSRLRVEVESLGTKAAVLESSLEDVVVKLGLEGWELNHGDERLLLAVNDAVVGREDAEARVEALEGELLDVQPILDAEQQSKIRRVTDENSGLRARVAELDSQLAASQDRIEVLQCDLADLRGDTEPDKSGEGDNPT